MSRKLASIQTIKALTPIEGADRIETAQILNWECVVKKGEFKVGDKVIYFEIDSLLPDIPMLEWLRGSSWSQKLNKYKIKTHIFRKQVSQGLVIPYDDLYKLQEEINGCVKIISNDDGTDLTELLGIEKYEPPVSNGPLGKTINHEWYVPKTDEERIQTCADTVLPAYKNINSDEYYESIKLDGTSCTAGLFEDGFLIGGRTQWYAEENMYTTTVKSYGDLEQKLKDYQKETGLYVVFQGELCGPGIQGNKLGLIKKRWFIFNVFTSTTGKNGSYEKVNFDELNHICDICGMERVPFIIGDDKLNITIEEDENITVRKLVKHANNFKYRTFFKDASPNQHVEGIVIRKKDMTNSFKVISTKFLLKGGE